MRRFVSTARYGEEGEGNAGQRLADEGSLPSNRKQNPVDEVTFYTITDERFFIGTVATVNSLRLMGHEQRVVALDCGLSKRQRDLLSSECELVALPAIRATNPTLFKPYANLLEPRGIAVVIDSDLIVAHRLDAVLEAVRTGQVCACADMEPKRWFAEWEQVFKLPGRPRRQTYVNAGFLAFSVEHWPDLLPRWWDSCQLIWSRPTIYEDAVWEDPTSQADQDALNAILMSDVPPGSLTVLPPEVQPDVEQLRYLVELIDVNRLSCSLHGKPVTLVHLTGKMKPWERQGWYWQGRHPYPTLLRRLVIRQDVRIRISHVDIPILWLRPGWLGAVAMGGLSLANSLTRIRKWRLLKRVYKLLSRQSLRTL